MQLNFLKVKIFKLKKNKSQNKILHCLVLSCPTFLMPYVLSHLICFMLYVLSGLICVQSSSYQKRSHARRVWCPMFCLVSCSSFPLCSNTSRASSSMCLHIACASCKYLYIYIYILLILFCSCCWCFVNKLFFTENIVSQSYWVLVLLLNLKITQIYI